MIESFPIPAYLNGIQLAAELGIDPHAVAVVEDELLITDPPANVGDILAAHIPPPKQPTFAEALDAATTIDELKATLKAFLAS